MNKIIKISKLQIDQNPNDIIKVAGVLSKIKKWILSLFDSTTREQITLIDSKYSQISSLISELQQNIIDIEQSIDSVDITAYDNAVKKLSNTLSELSEKTQESQKQIDNIQEKRTIKTRKKISNEEIINSFKSTLKESDISKSQIIYGPKNFEAFITSIKNSTNVLKFFNNNQDETNAFIQKIKFQNQSNIISNVVDDFKIISILEPIDKTKESRLKNVCVLKLRGNLPIVIDNEKYNIAMEIFIDVFTKSLDNLQQEIKAGYYKVFKQHVWGIFKE